MCLDVSTFGDKPLSVCFDDPSSVPRESRVDLIVATILSTPDIFDVNNVAVASNEFGNDVDGFTFCDCIVNGFDGCDVIVYDIISRDAVTIDAIMVFPVNGFDVVAMGTGLVTATAVLVPSTAVADCVGVAVLLEILMSLLYLDVLSTSCVLEGLPFPFPVEPGLLTKLVAASAWLCVTLSIFVNEYRDVSLVET